MAKNPSPMSMDDTGPNNSGHNDGFETSSTNGTDYIRAYGKDGSGMSGSRQMERGTPRGLGGGVDNLAHSLTGGVKANTTGRPSVGTKDRVTKMGGED